MHHLASLLSKNSLSSYNFQNAFQLASECTFLRPCILKKILSISNFQNIVSNSVRMHHFASLLSTFSQQFQLPKYSFK